MSFGRTGTGVVVHLSVSLRARRDGGNRSALIATALHEFLPLAPMSKGVTA